jgi:cyclohexanone monooxygenase
MSAYAGLTINGFPNLFLMTGPNTGLGHTSMVIMIEAQIGYVVDALRTMTRDGIAAIQPTAQAQQRWTDDVQRRMDGTVWTAGGCASWYLDEHGRNTTLWPDFTVTYRYRLRRFDPAAYHLEPLAQAISASREAISAASSG